MHNHPELFVGGLVTLISLSAFVVVHRLMERRRQHWEKRLTGGSGDTEQSGILSRMVPQKAEAWWGQRLVDAFCRMIQRTGLDTTPEEAFGAICLVGVLLAAPLFIWREQLWLAAVGLFLGSGGVFLIFWVLQRRHRRLLQNQLPDTLYMLARSLRTGMSLDQAIAVIAQQGMKPLAEEFQRAHTQIELGLTIPAALQLSAERLDLLDFNAFVSLVTLHHNTGGNLAILLDRLAASVRDHNQFRNHFLAATALGRTTAVFLAGFAPALLLLYAIFQPDFCIAFFQSTAGWITLSVVIALEVIGALWLWQLLRYDT